MKQAVMQNSAAQNSC